METSAKNIVKGLFLVIGIAILVLFLYRVTRPLHQNGYASDMLRQLETPANPGKSNTTSSVLSDNQCDLSSSPAGFVAKPATSRYL